MYVKFVKIDTFAEYKFQCLQYQLEAYYLQSWSITIRFCYVAFSNVRSGYHDSNQSGSVKDFIDIFFSHHVSLLPIRSYNKEKSNTRHSNLEIYEDMYRLT